MYSGQLVFAQLMEHLPLHTFRRCVQRYPSHYPTKTFSHLDQFLCMAFAQLTYRESLRDIETCLRAHQTKLYHLGIRGHMAKSTLADANEQRDSRIYMDFAMSLIHIARQLYARDSFAVELDQTVYALDTTTIDLCLSVFPWARFRSTKGGRQDAYPTRSARQYSHLHPHQRRQTARSQCARHLHPRSRQLLSHGIEASPTSLAGTLFIKLRHFFVIQGKSNLRFRRLYSRSVNKSTGLRCDQTIVLTATKASKDYPQYLRRIKFYDAEHDRHLVFLTNNFDVPALTIAQLYRCRWQVELFLQVDQTASSDQAVLRYQRKCRQDANLDRHHGVRLGRHREKTVHDRVVALHHSTDFELDAVRENPTRSIT